MKLHKQRIETYELYVSQNRDDLAQEELFQAKVIEEFLPKMLTEEEVRIEVLAAITQTGANSAQDMGKVMGVASKELAGLAEGRAISSKVGELLKK